MKKSYLALVAFTVLISHGAFAQQFNKFQNKAFTGSTSTGQFKISDKSLIKRFSPAIDLNHVKVSLTAPPTCKSTFEAEKKAATDTYNACNAKVDADFDALSNSQLVTLCGNNSMQKCYDDFAKPKKLLCQKAFFYMKSLGQFEGSLWDALQKLNACEATVKHDAYCEIYGDISARLVAAATALKNNCNIGDSNASAHESWCKGLPVNKRGDPKAHLEGRKKGLIDCVNKLPK